MVEGEDGPGVILGLKSVKGRSLLFTYFSCIVIFTLFIQIMRREREREQKAVVRTCY